MDPSSQMDPRRSSPSPQDAGGPPPPPALALAQMRTSGSSNEYTEGPTAARRGPGAPLTPPAPEGLGLSAPPQHAGASGEALPWRRGDGDSGQRLLGAGVVRAQPARAAPPQELKPLGEDGRGGGAKHGERCAACGRCVCGGCRRPRPPPACWLWGGRCLCSAAGAVEYGSCACCVRALFYHCSGGGEEEEEGGGAACADAAFSCAAPRCGLRWALLTLLAPLLPCLLCYPPARAALALCQRCWDRATRPGCRCAPPHTHRGPRKAPPR